MEITWYGHAFFEIETVDGTEILIDPFIENNPENECSADDFSPDIVAVTHGDVFDHASEACNFGAPVLCQSMMARQLKKDGYESVVDLNLGGTYAFEDVTFKMTHGFHSIGTASLDTEPPEYGGVAAGYLIDDGETKFYHSGDTCLFGDMKTVIGDIYRPDIAALPIGGRHTMEPMDAAVAADWLGIDAAIPMHYDTFEVIEQDPTKFADAISNAKPMILDTGRTIEYSGK